MPTSGGVYRCRGLSLGDSGAVAATPIRVAFLNDDQTPAPLPVPRPSPCPGLLRIVQALDGGICRIKLDAGRLDAAQARAVAAAARDCASGVIEATNRSNLQLRGVRRGEEERLVRRLLDAGLGPRHGSLAGADDVRNLMLSPAAGLDPHLSLDVRPLAARLLLRLQAGSRYHALSAKFAIQLDGGEDLAMLEHPHDIWLSPMPAAPTATLVFGLAGCPARDRPLAALPAERGESLVLALLDLFLERAQPQQTRMRHLLQELAGEPLLEALQARLDFPLRRDERVAAWRRSPGRAWSHLGVQPQRQPGLVMVGAAAPLGRLDSACLEGLAELVERHGDGSLRLTPWQGVLLPNLAHAEADQALLGLRGLGLLTEPDAPLARLIACSGSSACARGLADTKGDALRLAERLGPRSDLPQLHLCGCERSCAAAHRAPLTLLARSGGFYDLYRHDPCHPGFGQLLASRLTFATAADYLAALPSQPTSGKPA
ncbi:TPA: precorrin-3B synthase [Pseudomonas aeruginosa]|uniref:Precorrin-3B synthase n=1 Tax=Pseudomonas aeruginosa TaxID=287 RepID=A0A6B1YA30_PSEAI|nr:precorrin-3B synthase [Pseudomonas aeruginosa]KSF52063.2 precorrin-3B synthase [Pseudomonas aeruginosa]KSI94270.2 precorrin-3B synthase [Pseudomonas aeruginosa]MBG7393019.1 precorrin-3B synthase [Pseudomonas aeruginosa]MBO8288575.1 precorrin-3B synthase [Pseudomonas aeruginosa]